MIVYSRDFTRGYDEELSRELTVIASQSNQCPSLHDADGGVHDRFSRETVHISIFKPKNVTWKIKSRYLPAPIGQDFKGPRRSVDNLVHVLDGLARAAYFYVFAEFDRHSEA